MRVIRTLKQVKRFVGQSRKEGVSVGFVPTMGALHSGHLSLVARAKKKNDCVAVSIYVNPLQFGPKEDFKRYPRGEKADLKLLRSAGVDVVYMPDGNTFYADDFETSISVARLSRPLCGATRPIHFSGVCTVVLKLLNQLQPDILYLGQKDYQQFRVIEKMVRDMNVPTSVEVCPIVREKDGLAMSSRNIFLSDAERKIAPQIYKTLNALRRLVESGEKSPKTLKRSAMSQLKKIAGARVDYCEVLDAKTLEGIDTLKQGAIVLAAVAVCFTRTRLIDNILIKV